MTRTFGIRASLLLPVLLFLASPAGATPEDGEDASPVAEPAAAAAQAKPAMRLTGVDVQDDVAILQFSNPVAFDSITEDAVQLSPSVPRVKLLRRGDRLEIYGDFEVGRPYRAALRRIHDTDGQPLEGPSETTFTVRRLRPSLRLPDPWPIILPLEAPAILPVFVQGHAELGVEVRRVEAGDLSAYREAVEACSWGVCRDVDAFPGTAVTRQVRALDPARHQVLHLDLAQAIGDGPGHALVVLRVAGEDELPVYRSAWVTRTGLSLSVERGLDEVAAWVTDLASGLPLTGVRVSARAGAAEASTTPGGLARLPLLGDGAAVVWARRGADAVPVLLPAADPYMGRLFPKADRWFTLTDRPVYLPGERVQLGGWLRLLAPDGLRLPKHAGFVEWKVEAGSGQVAHGRASLSELGGFDVRFRLPERIDAPVRVFLGTPGSEADGAFGLVHQIAVADDATVVADEAAAVGGAAPPTSDAARPTRRVAGEAVVRQRRPPPPDWTGLLLKVRQVRVGEPLEGWLQLPFAPARVRLFRSCGYPRTLHQWIAEDREQRISVRADAGCGRALVLDVEAVPVSPAAGTQRPFVARDYAAVDLAPLRLDVRVRAERAAAGPDAPVEVAFEVRRADGRPASRAEVLVVAMDERESVNAERADPMERLFPRSFDAFLGQSRQGVVQPENWAPPPGPEPRSFCDRFGYAARQVVRAAPGVRVADSSRRPVARWVQTDEAGRATLELQLPGDEARWHVVGIAADGAMGFGVGGAAFPSEE